MQGIDLSVERQRPTPFPEPDYDPPLSQAGFMDLLGAVVRTLKLPESAESLQRLAPAERQAAEQVRAAAKNYIDLINSKLLPHDFEQARTEAERPLLMLDFMERSAREAADNIAMYAEQARADLAARSTQSQEPERKAAEYSAGWHHGFCEAVQLGRHPLSAAAQRALAERSRHTEVEGWTPEHDDAYLAGQLRQAAACYALFNTRPTPTMWPWAPEWWKPSEDQRRNIDKAVALLLAEGERLDRAAARPAGALQDTSSTNPATAGRPEQHECESVLRDLQPGR